MSLALVASQFLGLASPFAEKAMAAEVGQTVNVVDHDGTGHWKIEGTSDFVFCVEPQVKGIGGSREVKNLIGEVTDQKNGASGFGPWSQDNVTTLALAQEYIFNRSGRDLSDAYYLVNQTVWHYMRWGDLNMVDLMGDSDAMNTFVNDNKAKYIGRALLLYTPTEQSTAHFWLTPATGNLKLKKVSGDEAITSGNECYSLAGATYGVYSDEGCSNEVATLTTGEDGASNEVELNQGTYWVKEKTPGKGYALDDEAHRVDVQAGQTSEVTSSEPAKNDPFGLYIKKQDMDGRDDPQGDATLEGAEFEVKFYAVDPSGVDDASDLEGKDADRTWVVKTIESNGMYRATLSNKYKVSGDDWYSYNEDVDMAFVPLGVMTVTEKTAPQGYDKTDGTLLAKVVSTGDGQFDTKVETSGDWGTVIGTPLEHENGGAVNDQVVKGSGTVKGLKIDAELDEAAPQGAATLADAEVTLYNKSKNPVVVDGTEYAPGAEVKTTQTAEDGGYDFGCALPYGTYEVKETKASKGYLLNSEWSQTFSIREDGQEVDLTGEDSALKEQVKRGDFKLDKIDGFSQEEMAGIPFSVTSATTGESHVVVTDENGVIDTTSAHWAHGDNTNASDAAVADGKVADESKLTSEAGVWFSGSADKQCDAEDSRGAMPYDTYRVAELRCSKNEGKDLLSFGVTVTRDGYTVDKGTKENADVNIGTTLTYGADGKTCPASAGVKLTDTVQFEHVEKGEHTIHGELHAVDGDGNDLGVVATADKQFTNDVTTGTVEVEFTVDASEHEGCRLVAFEYLDGTTAEDSKASHEDINDEGQSVSVPKIGTEASGALDHEGDASAEQVEVTDKVSYSGLTPGDAYTMTATLHRQEVADDGTVTDAGPVKDASGNEVSAQVSFRPEASSGEVEVKVSFSNPGDLAGQDIVAFESLGRNGETFAVHADISDEGQTVHFPSVETEAASKDTADHDGEAKNPLTVTDKVHLENLTVGNQYKVSGTLHKQLVADDGTVTDGGEVTGQDGEPVRAETEFTAEGTEADVELEFTFDASGLSGNTVVAFEELTRDGVKLGAHADISDEKQSVHIPRIGTTLTSVADGGHEAKTTDAEDGYISLTDTVDYENLIVGKSYTLTCEMHRRGDDGEDAGTVAAEPCEGEEADNGRVKVSFTAEQASGSVPVRIKVKASDVSSGDRIVAFETLQTAATDEDGAPVKVATHADISDEGQTVSITTPEMPATPETPSGDTATPMPQTGASALGLTLLAAGGAAAAAAGGKLAWNRRRAGSEDEGSESEE